MLHFPGVISSALWRSWITGTTHLGRSRSLVSFLWYSPSGSVWLLAEPERSNSHCYNCVYNVGVLCQQRLQTKVIKIVDVSYGGENGFNQAIELASDALANVKFIQEKKLIGKSDKSGHLNKLSFICVLLFKQEVSFPPAFNSLNALSTFSTPNVVCGFTLLATCKTEKTFFWQ